MKSDEYAAQARSYKSELVGVFGFPVAENPTIIMMEAGFRAAGLDWRYLTLEVTPDRLFAAVEGMRAFGMRGINLTIPHKVAVLKHLDEVAEDAALIGAVNTVVRRGDVLRGENTDGKGFLTSLTEEAGVEAAGKRIMVLGAGGAARAITVELALAGAAHITVVNRNRDRGASLVAALKDGTPVDADFRPWLGPIDVSADTDVLVNATSIGLFPNTAEKPDLDYSTIRPGLVVCDVIPNPPRTAFLKEAEKRGAKTLDGLGMLVNQGTIAFKLWTGVDAPAAAMRAALAAEFGS